MAPSIEKIDPNLAAADSAEGLRWYDVRHLGVEGRGWSDTACFFDRFPARANGVVPEHVWTLSRHSAGMCVRFVTDSLNLACRWRLRFPDLAMAHMPATGVSGVDLYVRSGGIWRWTGIGVPRAFPLNTSGLAGDFPAGPHEFMLYLPLYNGVESVELGIREGASLARAAAEAGRPLCFYGTSIVQGGCAARPGMAYPAILGRRLGCPHINLGFSGNARMEPALADLLAELDPAAYVLDPLPNMTAELVRERAAPFVRVLRKARPATPIVLVENIDYQQAHMLASPATRTATSNAALRAVYQALRTEGVDGLHYVEGARLLGDDSEATVDGTHPTDVGFMRMADALAPVLRPLLQPRPARP